MTTNPSTENSGSLNRFDLGLWNRFIAIAQPFWYPTERNGRSTFFLLLFLLLIFAFSCLALLISAVTLFCQQLYPTFMEQTAGGLVGLSRWLTSPPILYVVLAGLIIPLIGFLLVRRTLQNRWIPWGFLALLILLSLSVSGMNVIISYVGNFFTTALSKRDEATFWRFLYVYAGVFVVATPIVVLYGYIRDLLGLYWRDWMTGKFLSRYFQNRAYYEINSDEEIDNPDQRISEDIRSFTTTSLFFLLIILSSVIDVISFTGILWSISQFLALFLIGYAVFGTVITALLGRRLITLNFNQLKKEADFRYGLVHIRDNAESIAFYRGEEQELTQVRRRFVEVLRNFNFLIGWQRNLSVFTTSYGYAIVILPSLIMAPQYFAGEIEFGDITQAGFAFRQVLDAFSLVIVQIERLSSFAAGINRLETFKEALTTEPAIAPSTQQIRTVEDDQIALDRVTLMTPKGQRRLVEELSFMLEPGEGLVIVGPSGSGKSSILRAIAGLWNTGNGQITRPDLSDMLFLPQRPYMVLGNLREQLLYPNTDSNIGQNELLKALKQVNLEDLPERVGGFEVELNWGDVLSLGEQQRLAFARLLLTQPRYAILDEATSALDLANEQRLYQQLKDQQVTFISVGHRPSLVQYHKYVLELTGDTLWQLTSAETYQVNVQSFS